MIGLQDNRCRRVSTSAQGANLKSGTTGGASGSTELELRYGIADPAAMPTQGEHIADLAANGIAELKMYVAEQGTSAYQSAFAAFDNEGGRWRFDMSLDGDGRVNWNWGPLARVPGLRSGVLSRVLTPEISIGPGSFQRGGYGSMVTNFMDTGIHEIGHFYSGLGHGEVFPGGDAWAWARAGVGILSAGR